MATNWGPRPDVERRIRIACAVAAVIAVAIFIAGAVITVAAIQSLNAMDRPLLRPEARLTGDLDLAPGGSMAVVARLDIDGDLVAHAPNATIDLEFDVEPIIDGLRATVETIDPDGVGVVVVDGEPIDAGADVRWAVRCPAGGDCTRTLRVGLELDRRAEAVVGGGWRLVARIRVPQGVDPEVVRGRPFSLVEVGR